MPVQAYRVGAGGMDIQEQGEQGSSAGASPRGAKEQRLR
eukprot:CAMPEP_0173233908 /NCGR_PEP_ID=MMETSP1142-20121109/9896_1 /TAXON_ID=483371 /ORGANISM="non described non described, Strain CCMP2298" /LENGTH=38 /DNA_ID= /DNA_START= /DNA_END= /DNA_ORIENTATION=